MRARTRRTSAAGAALALLLLTAGCASGGKAATAAPHPGGSGSGAGDSAPRPIDAPVAFALAGPAIQAQALTDYIDDQHAKRPAVSLIDTTAYIEERKDLLVADTVSGKTLATVAVPVTSESLVDDSIVDTAPPLVAEAGDGHQLVLGVWLAKPAAGPVIEVAAVDTRTKALAWSWSAPLPAGMQQPDHIKVLGRKGVALVAAQRGGGAGAIWALDLVTHQVRWKDQHFIASTMAGDTLVGVRLTQQDFHHRLTGVDPATEQERWHGIDAAEVDVQSLGPSYVIATQQGYNSNDPTIAITDAATGRVVTPLAPGLLPTNTKFGCDYDQQTTAVCVFGYSDALGIDAATGKIIWTDTDQTSSKLPTITAVWHGHIYGTDQDQPVLWDARTGKMVPQPMSVAPNVVDSYVGLDMGKETPDGLLYSTAGPLTAHRDVS